MADKIEILERQIKTEKELRNNLEQYTRKNNIKIINLPFDCEAENSELTEQKVIALFQHKLGLSSFSPNFISVAHRIGRFRRDNNRPVLVRFTAKRVIRDVFQRRRVLKATGSDIYINRT